MTNQETLNETKIQLYFEMFKTFHKSYHTPGVKRVSLLRSFSSAQGAFCDNSWRVVGITQAALDSFESIDFTKVPNRKSDVPVERAHMYQRNRMLSEMFEMEWEDATTWWNFIYERDTCVLATNSENRASEKEGAAPLVIAHEIPQDMGYFQANYIGCKYRKKVEKVLLESFINETK